MKALLYRAAGRASNVLDLLRRPDGGNGAPAAEAGRDRTGLLVRGARRLEVLHDDPAILYVRYDSMAHSFWRAQELSLIRAHRERLAPPVLDFGAGDGSFASAVFDRVEWGVDTDPDALAAAEGYGLYGSLVRCTNDRIPLPDGVAGSIVANSVLEHVGNLEATLAELVRVLRPGGRIAITVPLTRFTEHLAAWFGPKAAAAVNRESSHRNLFEAAEWVRRLERFGLTVEAVRHYQPEWFTYWYRMLRLLGPRGLGRVRAVQKAAWRVWGPTLVSMVRISISSTTDGANVFILACKAGA